MTLPSRTKIEIPLLTELIISGGRATPAEIYNRLSIVFQLTEDDKKQMTHDNQESVWNNRVRQARRTLVEKGQIDPTTRGVWAITQAGRARIETVSSSYSPEIPETHDVSIPEDLWDADEYFEGNGQSIVVDAYERNSDARQKCIDHYGASCIICDFSFENIYGDVGVGFIHVHHLRPLSEIGEQYQVDPIVDLRPVCPNCHAIIHRRNPAYTIDEVREILLECDRRSSRVR
jgi:5-methylcytosine-specific restriction protein A